MGEPTMKATEQIGVVLRAVLQAVLRALVRAVVRAVAWVLARVRTRGAAAGRLAARVRTRGAAVGGLLARMAVAGFLLVLATGCGVGTATPTGEPASLPPIDAPTSAASSSLTPAPPSPTPAPPSSTPIPPSPTPAPPTATATPQPSPTATPEPSPIPTVEATEEPVAITPIGQLHSGLSGQEVTVEGQVIGTASFAAGFKFVLDDGSGRIVLLMWHDVYDDCWDAAGLNIGAQVRVSGEIGDYQGELQIEPSWGGGVQVQQAASPWANPRQISTLSPADENQRVMIEGTVTRLEDSANWAKVFVNDGSGEMMVFLYRNIFDRVSNRSALSTPGTPVRVVGTVTIYQGALEIKPALPVDVVVGR